MFSQSQNSNLSNEGWNIPERRAEPPAAADSKKLILLVEDDGDSSNMLRTLLEIWRYRVIIARDGEEAIRLAHSESPKLILMDVGIPVIDGMEATRRIRQFAPADAMPVVFISGYAHSKFRLAALASGGNDYLVKPIDFKELETVIGKYIENRETLRGLSD